MKQARGFMLLSVVALGLLLFAKASAADSSPTTRLQTCGTARPTMPNTTTQVLCVGAQLADGGGQPMVPDGGKTETIALWNYSDGGTLLCRQGTGDYGIQVPNGVPYSADLGSALWCYSPVPQTTETGCSTVLRGWGP